MVSNLWAVFEATILPESKPKVPQDLQHKEFSLDSTILQQFLQAYVSIVLEPQCQYSTIDSDFDYAASFWCCFSRDLVYFQPLSRACYIVGKV